MKKTARIILGLMLSFTLVGLFQNCGNLPGGFTLSSNDDGKNTSSSNKAGYTRIGDMIVPDYLMEDKGFTSFTGSGGSLSGPVDRYMLHGLSANFIRTWKNATLPIYFSASITRDLRNSFLQICENTISLRSNLVCKEITEEDPEFVSGYIRVLKIPVESGYCGASIIGFDLLKTEQILEIADHCWDERTISHELMHAAGVFHEQNRPDRDDFIQVLFENILDENEINFEKIPGASAIQIGDYDFDSVMHYHGYAFSINGQPTIKRVDSGQPVIETGTMSNGDHQILINLYGAKEFSLDVEPPTLTFSAVTEDGVALNSGDTLTISDHIDFNWESTNANVCKFDIILNTDLLPHNLYSWVFSSETTRLGNYYNDTPIRESYRLTCSGDGGSAVRTIDLVWELPNDVPQTTLDLYSSLTVSGIHNREVNQVFNVDLQQDVYVAWLANIDEGCDFFGDWSLADIQSGVVRTHPDIPTIKILSSNGVPGRRDYGIYCAGPGGLIEKQISVNWKEPQSQFQPSLDLSFILNPNYVLTTRYTSKNVYIGVPVYLIWTSEFVSECTANDQFLKDSINPNMSFPGEQISSNEPGEKVYTISCTGDHGVVEQSVTVNWVERPRCNYNDYTTGNNENVETGVLYKNQTTTRRLKNQSKTFNCNGEVNEMMARVDQQIKCELNDSGKLELVQVSVNFESIESPTCEFIPNNTQCEFQDWDENGTPGSNVTKLLAEGVTLSEPRNLSRIVNTVNCDTGYEGSKVYTTTRKQNIKCERVDGTLTIIQIGDLIETTSLTSNTCELIPDAVRKCSYSDLNESGDQLLEFGSTTTRDINSSKPFYCGSAELTYRTVRVSQGIRCGEDSSGNLALYETSSSYQAPDGCDKKPPVVGSCEYNDYYFDSNGHYKSNVKELSVGEEVVRDIYSVDVDQCNIGETGQINIRSHLKQKITCVQDGSNLVIVEVAEPNNPSRQSIETFNYCRAN